MTLRTVCRLRVLVSLLRSCSLSCVALASAVSVGTRMAKSTSKWARRKKRKRMTFVRRLRLGCNTRRSMRTVSAIAMTRRTVSLNRRRASSRNTQNRRLSCECRCSPIMMVVAWCRRSVLHLDRPKTSKQCFAEKLTAKVRCKKQWLGELGTSCLNRIVDLINSLIKCKIQI